MIEFFFLLINEWFFCYIFSSLFLYYLYLLYVKSKWVDIYYDFYYLKIIIILFFIGVLYILLNMPVSIWVLFDYMIYSDYLIYLMLLIYLIFFIFYLFIIIICKYDSLYKSEVLFIFVILSLCVFICFKSNDILHIYLYIETITLAVYILLAVNYLSIRIAEAVLKYFFLSIILSCFFLYGLLIIYINYMTFNLIKLKIIVFFLYKKYLMSLSIVGLIFIFVFFFKLGIFPFHFWLVEVYFGVLDSIYFFLLVFLKYIFFFIFFKILLYIDIILYFDYLWLFMFCSILCIFIGSIGSFSSNNLKQIFAYSSISHNGFLLLCFSKLTLFGLYSFIIYLIGYSVIILYLFLIFVLCKQKYYFLINLIDFNFFSSFINIVFSFLGIFLSFSGVPPFLGFFIKLIVLFNLLLLKINSFFFILFILLVNMINIYVYIRMIVYLFFFSNNYSILCYKFSIKILSCLSFFFFFNLIGYLFFIKYIYIYIYYNYLFLFVCYI